MTALVIVGYLAVGVLVFVAMNVLAPKDAKLVRQTALDRWLLVGLGAIAFWPLVLLVVGIVILIDRLEPKRLERR